MGVEIERKFLVDHEKWHQTQKPKGDHFRQGYLLNDDHKTIRVRVTDEQGYVTFKGATQGISRSEHEYKIPVADGNELLNTFAISELKKVRYRVQYEGKLWEIDEFSGDNEGLIVAEIELQHENEEFKNPAWLAAEVSNDERYYNSNLAVNPFKNWGKQSL